MIDGIVADTAPICAAMDWAEDEIAANSRRRTGQADAIYHAFEILTPRDIGPGMGTEVVFRGAETVLRVATAVLKDLTPAEATEPGQSSTADTTTSPATAGGRAGIRGGAGVGRCRRRAAGERQVTGSAGGRR